MTLGEVRVSDDAGWPVAQLSGAIDLSNVEELRLRLERAVSNRAHGLVLDLSAVTYLDSTGLRLLFRLARQLGNRQQRLHLVVPDSSRISRVLEIAGVASVIPIASDLAYLRRGEEEEVP